MILKLTNLFLLLASTAWLTKAPDWEPLIAFVTFLSGFIFQEFKDGNSEIKKKEESHDKELFCKLLNYLPEDEFKYNIDNEIWNLRTDSGYARKIRSFLNFANSVEGSFANEKVQKEFSAFISKLSELSNFIASHFFVPRSEDVTSITDTEGNFILLLYPDLKSSDDAQKRKIYSDRMRELQLVVNDTANKYELFRKTIKSKYYI